MNNFLRMSGISPFICYACRTAADGAPGLTPEPESSSLEYRAPKMPHLVTNLTITRSPITLISPAAIAVHCSRPSLHDLTLKQILSTKSIT
jgi:hypothetical protein